MGKVGSQNGMKDGRQRSTIAFGKKSSCVSDFGEEWEY